MSADGVPEFSTKRLGEEIARLRTARGWSRTKLVNRLFDALTDDSTNRDSIGEAWLARLETGRMVKVPRGITEALCRALNCTSAERAHLLLLADRNILANSDAEVDPIAETLNYVMDRLYHEANEILSKLIEQHGMGIFAEQEQFELVATALELVLAKQRALQTLRSPPDRE